MKFKSYILFFIFITASTLFGQQVVVDTNFLNFLKSNYPSVVDSKNNLIPSVAANITGNFDASGLQIKKIDEIQYFTSITGLNLNNNLITELPDISSLTSLKTLDVSNNKLSILPELSSLGQLTSLNVSRNLLTSMVSVSSLNKLKIIDASFNKITTLPNINNLTSLTSLDFSNNGIQNVAISFNHPALITLSLGNNVITSVPDLSSLTSLQTLELSYNKLTNVPNLIKNTLLKAVYLNNNNIDTLPPNLWIPTTVKNLRVEKNNLTFDDLLPLINITNYETVLTYAPQKTSFKQSNIIEKRGNSVVISPSQDKNVTGLLCNWSKNGFTVGTAKNVLISSVQFADSGLYKLSISHTALPDLTYESDFVTLKVTECVDTNFISHTTTAIQCLLKGKIEIKNASTEKYSYKLISKNTQDTIVATNNIFSDLTFPSYEIMVVASNNCFVKKIQPINVPVEFCKEIIITPNADGENDDYYFNQSGDIHIYDKNNLLVTTLVGPCFWDAKSNNKPLPIGYYSAYIHNSKEKLGVTIMY